MISLNNLPSSVSHGKKRVGRGYGSGKGGHTVGRGQKGQKSRSKIHPLFEGQKNKKSLVQRLPVLRGKGRLKPGKKISLSTRELNKFDSGATVSLASLKEKGLVANFLKKKDVKIVLNGVVTKKLTVSLPTTKNANDAIVNAGGTVSQ